MSLNNLGTTVEQCQQIRISDFLVQYRLNIKQSIPGNTIEVSGRPVELVTSRTGNGGVRYWFKCPACGRRIGSLVLLHSRMGCRVCLGLQYRKQRYKGMVENVIN